LDLQLPNRPIYLNIKQGHPRLEKIEEASLRVNNRLVRFFTCLSPTKTLFRFYVFEAFANILIKLLLPTVSDLTNYRA